MKMDKPPRVETATKETLNRLPETGPDYQGGVTEEEATRIEQEYAERVVKDNKKVEELSQGIKNMSEGQKNEVSKEGVVPRMDLSIVKSKIKEMEEKAANQSWLRRQFTDTGETIKRLKLGLYKIEDPKFQGKFEADFQEAFRQGGEEFAMEYLEDIGAGKLVRPENGVMMASDKRNQDKFFNQ